MGEHAIQFRVVTDDAGFLALETEWRRIFDSLDETHFFQSFDWCRNAWVHIASKAGRRLRIVVGSVDGRVVLILPLVIAGQFLRLLGTELFEFHDVLVLPGADRDCWIRAAIDAAGRIGGSGILLRDARADGDLSAFLDQGKTRGRSRISGKTSYVQLSDFPGWEAFFETLPKQLKSDQRRQWKRLAELPEPGRFEIVEDAAGRENLLSWLHAEKIKWLDAQKGTSGGGLYGSDDYRRFLSAIIAALSERGQVMMCRVASGNETLAGLLGFTHRGYFVFFMFDYAPKWSGYSPGRLVMAKAIEWCFSRRLRTFDMLLGPEEYKAVWSTHVMPIRDYFVPLGRQGRIIEKWHDSGCSRFFAKPWISPAFRMVPGKLRTFVGGRLAAQRELIAEMRPL